MIGKTISHYKILEKLGEGGMGVVYKAMDTTLGRLVALKFVSAAGVTDELTKKRLMREAKACALLNHPNITTIYEFGQADERSFIAMEYVEGQTLQALVEQKRFELCEVLEIALQAADALDAAHSKGIIHRDLKSANIMIDANGGVKIMDFGLAKLSKSSLLTQTGVTLGTAAYMSPEQARGEEIDSRSDIYSMGVILYQLSTGELPFAEAHHLAVMYAVINEDPRPPRELNPEIPPELQAVILKAMEKDPDSRYQNFEEMANDLMELQEAVVSADASKEPSQRVLIRRPGRVAKAKGREKTVASQTKKVLIYILPILLITGGVVTWFLKDNASLTVNSKREIAKTHVNSAIIYLKENKREPAKRELELAVKSDPTYSAAWSSLAALNIQAQQLDVAISQSRKAIELDKSNSNAYYNLAYALEEKGELHKAIEKYSEAVKVDSTFTQAYSALGNLFIKLDRPEDAVRILERAVGITHESEYIYLIYKNLGKAYFTLNRHDDAIKFLQRSLQLQPMEVPETIYFLAMAYEAAGLIKESIANWQHYIEIQRDTLKQREAMNRLEKLTK
ncbi:MAG: protein kinase [bacterium]